MSEFSNEQIRRIGWHPPIEELPVIRGIVYLILWLLPFGWVILGFAGQFIAGEIGAIVGLVLVVPVGLFGYDRYLAWHVKRISADYSRTVSGIVERLRSE